MSTSTPASAKAYAKATIDANARLAGILADERSKGRERAALQLASKNPTMPAGDVLAFVAENVPVAGPAPTSPGASRLNQAVKDRTVSADAKSGAGYSAEASLSAMIDRQVAASLGASRPCQAAQDRSLSAGADSGAGYSAEASLSALIDAQAARTR